MRVFVTGATGFIGSQVVKELIAAGNQVLGLARSEAGAQALADSGAEVQQGTLEDVASLRSGAAAADAVLHLAFIHDFSKFQENCQIDKQAIEALGSVLAGSGRPLIVTSGVAGLAVPGRLATEDTEVPSDYPLPRVSEQTALSLKGVNASVMRLPQVHDPVKQGLVTYLVAHARKKACRPTWEKDAIAGRPRTCRMSPASTGWRWRSMQPVPSIMRWPKKACRCVRLPKPSVRA